MTLGGVVSKPVGLALTELPCCSDCVEHGQTRPRLPGEDLRRSRFTGSALTTTAPELRSQRQELDRPSPRPVLHAGDVPRDAPIPGGTLSLGRINDPTPRPRYPHVSELNGDASRRTAWLPPTNGGAFVSLGARARNSIGIEPYNSPSGIPVLSMPLPGCVLAGPGARMSAAVRAIKPAPVAPMRGALGAQPDNRRQIDYHPASYTDNPGIFGVMPGLDSGRVDIYFSAGKRENWAKDGKDGDGYRSCDDGNERNCELWRVQWDFATELAGSKATRVRSKGDLGYSSTDSVAVTMPAVSPSGEVVAYAVLASQSENVFTLGGDFSVRSAVPGPGGGWGGDVHEVQVAWPNPWGGSVVWPAFLGEDGLLTTSDSEVGVGDAVSPGSTHRWFAGIPGGFNASFKTVSNTWLKWGGAYREAGSLSGAIAGPGEIYELMGISEPDEAVSTAVRGYAVAADAHAHLHVLYDGVDRGPRIVAFGDHHDQDEGLPGTPRVYDPGFGGFDFFGVAVEETDLPSNIVDSHGGCHHPTWNVAGDMFQCSHMQGDIDVAGTVASWRRTLHGFRWGATRERWKPWRPGNGELFPWSEVWSGYTTEGWYNHLPDTLIAASEGLSAVLPDPVTDVNDDGPRCRGYTWKYGHFCGSDDYVVAMFTCTNEDWLKSVWNTDGLSKTELDTVLHFDKLMSRIVLIRLADGHHWDLTSLVAKALGSAEDKDPLNSQNIFGIFPTCGPLKEARSFPGVGLVLNNAQTPFVYADYGVGYVDDSNA